MARFKPKAKKLRLARKKRQTKWAPFWVIPKIHGKPKKVRPSRYTHVKRSWKRTKIKA